MAAPAVNVPSSRTYHVTKDATWVGDNLVDNLFQKAIQTSAFHNTDFDETTLGKPSTLASQARSSVGNLPMLAQSKPQPSLHLAGYRATQAAVRRPRRGWNVKALDDPASQREVEKPRKPDVSKALVPLTATFSATAAQAHEFIGEKYGMMAAVPAVPFPDGGAILAGLQKAVDPVMSALQGLLSTEFARQIGLSLANTVIAWGVPLGATLVLIGALSKPKPDPTMQDPAMTSMSPFNFFKKPPDQVTEYLKIERLNDELESYSYSMTKALRNERQAKLEKQRAKFARIYGTEIASHLNSSQVEKLVKADTKFRREVCQIRLKSDKLTKELRAAAAKSAEQKPGMMSSMMGGEGKSMQEQQAKLAQAYSAAEFGYIKAISAELPKDTRKDFTNLLKTSDIGLQADESPFLTVEQAPSSKPHVFCIQFKGDIQAKQVDNLRKEVTAVVRTANATRKDEVVLRLSSPGGTVTGYGSAAAQLMRIKNAGLKLTICVEEVAASGGYMMACVADHLVASPMAVLGSIGVISELPNVYERLNKEGIEFLTVTAGEYKRTLTPFKKKTREDEEKAKEDVGMIWTEFKTFVQEQRPVLDVAKYGTGETWYGRNAMERNLCDELANSDDIILDKLEQGAEIYGIKYKPQNNMLAQLGIAGAESDNGKSVPSTLRTLAGRMLLGESLADIVEPPSLTRRHMAIDRTAGNAQFLDRR
eukprot:gnl/TRDRNA2_/TRDRNA2_188561_c0_seq1.p1 gnl/TRDRNA2_/TRDRNA2_188561_c0~~gnl/TRDRNA2_/TRDRNA2_188561_c0_seq1.p1  ORF type:complete len:768 (-),score=147.43 gnl/TRDRNA2_/TRDRNA2_188561_c0_seq1:230-2347(-)